MDKAPGARMMRRGRNAGEGDEAFDGSPIHGESSELADGAAGEDGGKDRAVTHRHRGLAFQPLSYAKVREQPMCRCVGGVRDEVTEVLGLIHVVQ